MNQDILISVGIPVYNSETTIARCLDSIIRQTHQNLEIIISDNGSTDRTFDICTSYAISDPRIVISKQEINIGPAANFRFVLEQSHGEFFCWVASDDVRSPDFIFANQNFLIQHAGAAASTSPHVFLLPSNETISGKSLSICGELNHRVKEFLSDPWNSHALFYSLFRRELLLEFPHLGRNFLAWDWAIIFHILQFGNIHRIDSGLITLQSGGQSNKVDALKMSGVRGIKYLAPLSDFTAYVMNTFQKKNLKSILSTLLLLSKLHVKISKYEYLQVKHWFKYRLLEALQYFK